MQAGKIIIISCALPHPEASAAAAAASINQNISLRRTHQRSVCVKGFDWSVSGGKVWPIQCLSLSLCSGGDVQPW